MLALLPFATASGAVTVTPEASLNSLPGVLDLLLNSF
jgi:hypothetical protein